MLNPVVCRKKIVVFKPKVFKNAFAHSDSALTGSQQQLVCNFLSGSKDTMLLLLLIVRLQNDIYCLSATGNVRKRRLVFLCY